MNVERIAGRIAANMPTEDDCYKYEIFRDEYLRRNSEKAYCKKHGLDLDIFLMELSKRHPESSYSADVAYGRRPEGSSIIKEELLDGYEQSIADDNIKRMFCKEHGFLLTAFEAMYEKCALG